MNDPAEKRLRAGWEAAFKLMHERGEDRLLIDDEIDLEFEWGEWESPLTTLPNE